MQEPDYSPIVPRPHRLIAVMLGIILVLAGLLSAAAQGSAVFSGGGKAGKTDAYAAYEYAAAPYAVDYDGMLYLYATADDGKGYYTTYEGGSWSEYAGWDDQPADFQWQPTAVTYGGSQYVYYTGTDNKLYQNVYDGQSWSGWEEISGGYEAAYCAYANTYGDSLYVYLTAADGNVYARSYDGSAWSEWAAINDGYAAGAYQPYAVEWNDYENVFWTGEDGTVYWNRYDGSAWTGAKALEGDYAFATDPYAVGYEGDLYAYAIDAEGVPYHNVFTEGEGWAGWEAYPARLPAKAEYQPSVAVYDGAQHMVYTAADGHAYYTSHDGSWSDEWIDLGDNYAYEAIQYEYEGGSYLAYTGADGDLYYAAYDGGAQAEPTEEDGY